MPVEEFIIYKSKYYGIGTRLKFRNIFIYEGVIERFINNTVYIRGDNGILYDFGILTTKFDDIIIEIIKPVYYIPSESTRSDNRNCPASWDVGIGWIWYIIIMIVGAIFNDRFLIWIMTTIIFFLWKNGKLGGKK